MYSILFLQKIPILTSSSGKDIKRIFTYAHTEYMCIIKRCISFHKLIFSDDGLSKSIHEMTQIMYGPYHPTDIFTTVRISSRQ